MGSQKRLQDEKYKALQGLLRQWRRDADLTQSELAEKMNKSVSFVAKSEIGERRIDPIELRDWIRGTGVKVSKALRTIAKL